MDKFYYFRDLVDSNSENYDKILVLRATDDEDAVKELAIRHRKQYNEELVLDKYELLEISNPLTI